MQIVVTNVSDEVLVSVFRVEVWNMCLELQKYWLTANTILTYGHGQRQKKSQYTHKIT
jgi:hypothetical protein